MVVEHVFVTTHEWPDAMAIVADSLTPFGFTVDPTQAFSMDPGVQQPMGLTRNKKGLKGRKLKPVLTPTRVRMAFDRGRINLALAVEDAYSGGGIRMSRYSSAPKRVVTGRQQYLIKLAEIIQAVASGYIEPTEAAHQHAAAEDDVRKLNRSIRNRSLMIVGIVFALVFGSIILVAVVSSR